MTGKHRKSCDTGFRIEFIRFCRTKTFLMKSYFSTILKILKNLYHIGFAIFFLAILIGFVINDIENPVVPNFVQIEQLLYFGDLEQLGTTVRLP